MNINEVKKHVTFQLILYILIGICFIISLFAILTTNVNASEMKQYNISQTIRNTTSCGTQTYGSYDDYDFQANSTNDCFKENINTSYTDFLKSIRMDVSVNTWYQNAPSTIEIYNANNSFRNINYSCQLSATNSTNNIPCTVVYVNSGKIIVNFNTNLYQPYVLWVYPSSSNYIAQNYNINKIMLLETVDSANSDVISNANQNTSDIINNANTNTQDIMNNANSNTETINNTMMSNAMNIIKQLTNYCDNAVNVSKIVPGFYNSSGSFVTTPTSQINGFNTASGSININISQYGGVTSDYIAVDSSLSYYLKLGLSSGSNGFYQFTFFDSNKQYLSSYNLTTQGHICQNQSACMPLRAAYMRFSYRSNIAINNLTLGNITINASNNAFCTFGTYSNNKLDGIQGAIQGGLSTVDDSINDVNDTMQDVKDLQQEQNDYLMDDSNPTINESGIDDVLSEVEISDPLNYLLTLPISLLQKLNTVLSANSCQRVSFGTLYDTELYLPCINFEQIIGSPIWNTIDLIAGVGLLAIILKRFYDSISNILTLGKEKEVRDKLDLPTPMQFMASILGGGRD